MLQSHAVLSPYDVLHAAIDVEHADYGAGCWMGSVPVIGVMYVHTIQNTA